MLKKIVRNLAGMSLRLLPLYKIGVRLSHSWILSKLTNKKELVVVKLRNGVSLLTYVNDYDGRVLFYWGDYDRRITYICSSLLRPGDVFFDIGSNYGEVGMFAAKRVGVTGQVHVFEPQSELADLIKVSARMNNYEHLHVHQVALSDHDGEGVMNTPQDHTGMATLEEFSEKSHNVGHKIQVCHSGKYFEKLKLPSIRAMKLDVEGHEARILKGAAEIIKKYCPAAIVFECHENEVPFAEREVVNILKELDYVFFQVSLKPYFHVVLNRIQNDGNVGPGYDFVAFHKSSLAISSMSNEWVFSNDKSPLLN